ncbi:response regulator transcription factor [Niastella caeni]|uniref:Response regulator transcription factor n=1 Tax=Niastella caeni TaxID=2569763 RepID=A0A4S8HV98_9BACT|nr:response regulator transcription factor [Niastella caeni]THU39588.1 response regulator transcription factor [Niastella caeni]
MNDQPILIVDDHRLFAEGVRSLLSVNGFTFVNILSDGRQLASLLETQAPRLLLMDIAMEHIDGIELSAMVRKQFPAIKILIVSMYTKRIYIEKLLQTGIDGYLIKNAGDEELISTVCTILEGGRYFSPQVGDILLKSMHASSGEAVLTPREKDVLQLIAEGYSTKEISSRLFVSVNTVETHRKNMLLKTGLRNVAHLIKWAYENGHL